MAELAAIEGVVAGAAPPPLPVSLPSRPRVVCVKCAADVTALPEAARFCNRCGSSLPEQSGRTAPAPPASAGATPPPPSDPFDPPQILLAYARALFNLGWRYETAVGSRRNLDEAARCYWKAARLGDAGARLRFEGAPGTNDLPRHPPPLATVHAPPPAS